VGIELSRFGKTADYRELSLLFFHEFTVCTRTPSGLDHQRQSNNSMVDERFERVKQTTAVAILCAMPPMDRCSIKPSMYA
jgi:hypothetical protein